MRVASAAERILDASSLALINRFLIGDVLTLTDAELEEMLD